MVSKTYKLNNNNNIKPTNNNNCEKENTVEIKVPQKDNLESVLSDFKISGLYHIKLLFLISLLIINNSQHSINYIFAAEKVDFRCKNINCENTTLLPVKSDSTIDYKCHKYDLYNKNGICDEDNINISSATDCTEWIYQQPNSFVAEFNLGCEEWKRTLVGTMHSIGFTIGLLFIGTMSDKIGRKKLIIFNIVASGLIGLPKSIVTSYWVYIALEMLEPMFGNCYAATFTMAIEMVTTRYRPTIIMFLALATAIGELLTVTLVYFTPNWRIYLVCIYAPSLLFILYIFWMDESLRWQLINDKKIEAEKTIRKAANMNKIMIEESRIRNLNCEKNSLNAKLWNSIQITISSRKMFVRLFICVCMWFTLLFNNYTFLIISATLQGDKYINFCLVALSGALSGVILMYVLPRFERKTILLLTLALNGVFCMSNSLMPKGYEWLATVLYLSGKVNTSMSIRISYLYTTELFPTYTRNTMLALCSCLGRMGAILAPQTPLLLKYWTGLPSLLMGILSLLTAILVTMIPDTSKEVLPDNVQQAEAIGKK